MSPAIEQLRPLLSIPGGIARLRPLILEWAFSGRLVPPNGNDESAHQVAEQALVSYRRLVSEGVIRAKAGCEGHPERGPYALPPHWRWMHLGHVGRDCGQGKPDRSFTYIDVGSIDNAKGRITDELSVLQAAEAPSRARKRVEPGCVIFSTVRPYLLNVAVIDRPFNPSAVVSTAFAVINPFEGISPRFLFHYLRSPVFSAYVSREMRGQAYPAINDEAFHRGLFPLAPLGEQQRVVERLEQFRVPPVGAHEWRRPSS